jgi:hypothetical protein
MIFEILEVFTRKLKRKKKFNLKKLYSDEESVFSIAFTKTSIHFNLLQYCNEETNFHTNQIFTNFNKIWQKDRNEKSKNFDILRILN